eukprot:COSAG01_NODE_6567_length_3605_cov_4.754136_4_plen_188_part_00
MMMRAEDDDPGLNDDGHPTDDDPEAPLMPTAAGAPSLSAGAAAAVPGAAAAATPATTFRRRSAHFSPCGPARLSIGFVSLLVPVIAGVTFVPFVLQNRALKEGMVWALLDVAVFLVLLSLLLVSWLHTLLVCPGTTPFEWHDDISKADNFVRQQFRFCQKTRMYRPPRSHYCSMTRRVVLNMDHFCP